MLPVVIDHPIVVELLGCRIIEHVADIRVFAEIIVYAVSVDVFGALETLSAGTLGCC